MGNNHHSSSVVLFESFKFVAYKWLFFLFHYFYKNEKLSFEHIFN